MARRCGMPLAVAVCMLLMASPALSLLKNFKYDTNPVQYVIGQAITTNVPSFVDTVGPSVLSNTWTIAPNLASYTGLIFNSQNGQISGTPNLLLDSPTFFTISRECTIAGLELDCVSYELLLSVVDAVPVLSLNSSVYDANLVESDQTIILEINKAVSLPSPVNAGGDVTSWSMFPALPSGLSIDATGRLVGTPSKEVGEKSYQITGKNSGGSASLVFNLEIVDTSTSTVEEVADEAKKDSETALEVSYVTLSGLFLFSVISLLIFIAWRKREKNTPPPMLVSENVMERLSRRLGKASGDWSGSGGSTSGARRPSLIGSGSGTATMTNMSDTASSARSRRAPNFANQHSRSRQQLVTQPSNVSEMARVALMSAQEADDQARQKAVQMASTPQQLFKALNISRACRRLAKEVQSIHDMSYLTTRDLEMYIDDEDAREILQAHLDAQAQV